MRAGRHGIALPILASAVAMLAVLAGAMGRAAADQTGAGRAFGSGRCGPIDASYIRVANATGGQPLPLGPTEVGATAPLMAASFNAETVFWATAALTSSGQTVTVPVDDVTSRIAFVLSTDGSVADMTLTDPVGTLVTAGTGVEAFSFGCVRGFAVEQPVAGEWTLAATGTGTYWLVVHARSELGLDEAAFVQVAGRPAHEGLFRIPGQPVAGRPATLRARVTREEVADATFDLVSMSGARLQAIALSPVTASSTEEEYVGEIANLPSVPFRVRVSGRDRTGAVYQRVSGPAGNVQGAQYEYQCQHCAPDGRPVEREARLVEILERLRLYGYNAVAYQERAQYHQREADRYIESARRKKAEGPPRPSKPR